MAAFLVEATETRMLLLQALQRSQGFTGPVQAALVGCNQVQDITVPGRANSERFGSTKCLAVPLHSSELADARQLELDRNHTRFIGSQWIAPRQCVPDYPLGRRFIP